MTDLNEQLEEAQVTEDNVVMVREDAVPAPTRSWQDADPKQVADMLERRGMNRDRLIGWVRANLKEGADFGVIKNRKSLWKAGAEKIAGMLGLQVNWPDLHDELRRLRDHQPSTMFLSCELVRDGVVMAQGAGARSIEQDGGDWNKTIKMCKKSAMIDAVLNVAGLSEVFTQDIEDDFDQAVLSEDAVRMLEEHAERLFPEAWEQVLHSLARRRFHFDDGDYRRIPAFRFHDALRSLTDKAEGS